MFRPIEKVVPNPLGQIRHADGPIYNHMPRELPDYAVIHDSVVKRMKDGMPMYAPESLFQLNQRILEKRDAIRTKVDKLKGTGSITETEAEEVKEWSESKLKIVKWEDYLEKKVMSERGRRTIGELINPAKELGPDGNFEPTSPASGSNGHPWRVFRRRWNPPADKSEEKNDSPPEKTDSPNDSSD